MERLTYVDARGRVLFTPSEEVDENPDIGYDIRQIAEYGYREYLSLIAERLANREQYCEMLEDELKTYKDAEEQGLLLRLKLKVGDTFWELNYAAQEPYIYPRRAHSLQHVLYCMDRLGKVTFLTENEAEAALEKMKGDTDEQE